MSVAAATTSESTPGADSNNPAVVDRLGVEDKADLLIQQRIAEARRALWWGEMVRRVLGWVIAAMIVVTAWVFVDQWVYSGGLSLRLAVWVAFVSASILYFARRIWPLMGSSVRPEYAARSLERDLPEMKQALTSYVTLRPTVENQATGGGLTDRVVRSIGARTATRLKSHDALPEEATGTLWWWLATAGILAVMVAYALFSPKNSLRSASRLAAPLAKIEPARRVAINDVRPGDSDAMAGRKIAVSARVNGLREDEKVWCQWNSFDRRLESELAYDQDSRRFAGELELSHGAAGEVEYFVIAGDAQAGPFRLMVDDVPVVAVESIGHEPPAYTGQKPYTSSSGAITAIDGTRITVFAKTNRPIAKATVEFNPRPLGKTIQATAGATEMEIDQQGRSQSVAFALKNARGRSAAVQVDSYRIRVWDDGGQGNTDPIIYPVRVIPDYPPEVAIVMPRQSPKNVPLDAQQVIEVHASDPDFGLTSVSLRMRRGIDLLAEPILWSDPVGAKGNRVTEYRFRPTEHGLRIGDVVEIRAIATDNRSLPNDRSVEPNLAQTDAIQIRITASESLPDQRPGGENDGLSPPDERPPTDDPKQSKEQSGDAGGEGNGSGQQGGGTGGEGSQSSSGDSGSSGQSGSGDSEQKGESGEQGQGGDSQSGTSADSDSGDRNDGASGGDESASEGSNSDSDRNASSDGGQGSKDSATNGGQPGTSDPADSADPSDSADGQAGDQDASGQQGEGQGADGSDGANSDSPQSNQGSQPPKHDGEAFERIRDYLEKQNGRNSGEAPPSDSSEQSKGTSGPDSDRGSDGKSGAESTSGAQGNQPQAGEDRQGSSTKASQSNQQGKTDSQEGGRSDQSDGGSRASQDRDGDSPDADGRNNSEGKGSQSQEGTSPQQDQESQSGGREGADESGSAAEQRKQTGDSSSQNQESKSGESQGQGEKPQGKPQTGSNSPDSQRGDRRSDSDQDDSNRGSGEESKDSQESQPPGDQDSQDSQDSGNRDDAQSGQPSGNEGKGSSGDRGKSDQSQASDDSSSESSDRPAGDSSTPTQNPQQTDDSSTDAKSSQGGSGSGSDTDPSMDPDSDESIPPPPPADLEYAKKATDMVLDYLESTRDKPDHELLDQLDWTPEDLRRFSDRWQRTRELGNSGATDEQSIREFEDALKSLGLSESETQSQSKRQAGDSLRRLRDAGNRRPPPPSHRDAFDAFRRAIGQ